MKKEQKVVIRKKKTRKSMKDRKKEKEKGCANAG
jgi:hypothetical protein